MDFGRKIIYFSFYEDGVKVRQAGYAGILIKETYCDVQIYYRDGDRVECSEGKELRPVFVFQERNVMEGPALTCSEGVAMVSFRTSRENFLQSGKSLEELELIYLDGMEHGVCGGRVDGQELAEEAATTLTEWMETVTEYIPESGEVIWEEPDGVAEEAGRPEVAGLYGKKESKREEIRREIWTLAQCLEKLPVLKLPFDGRRRRCSRLTLEDLEHFPMEWEVLKNNHFLLHGYYEYHHLALLQLCSRYGERYALGVPGEYCYRTQYMAESFGFHEFAPLEPGKRCRGSFGYWYFYLDSQGNTVK